MEGLLDLLDTTVAWAAAQPPIVQVGLGIALLAVAYFLYVVIAITLTAFYAAFFR